MDTTLARISHLPAPEDSFAECLLAGLGRTPKEIACKFFYDEAGSRLFDQICELPEYYQTRTETQLLARHAGEIAALIGPGMEILEFGAGSLRKVRILLDAAQDCCAYTPLDISGAYLAEVVRTLAADYPALTLRPLVGDFTLPLDIPALPGNPRRAGFFSGQHHRQFQARCRRKPAAAHARVAEWRRVADRRGPGEGPGAAACRL